MANTVTQRTLFGDSSTKRVIREVIIESDGSEETDLVVYDNSAFIANTSAGVVEKIEAFGSSCTVKLEWDQTTDSPIAAFDPSSGVSLDFRPVGGIKNPGATGATGDVVLTTLGLAAENAVTIKLHLRQK